MKGGAAQRIQVGAVVDVVAFDGLRADVLHCADCHPGGCQRGGFTGRFGDTEVGELDCLDLGRDARVVDADQDVGRFHVAVGDALLAPRIVQGRGGAGYQLQRQARVDGPAGLEKFRGVGALDVLHRDPQSPLELTAVVQGNDVRVRQLREQVRFPLEARLEVVVARHPGVEQLECVTPW